MWNKLVGVLIIGKELCFKSSKKLWEKYPIIIIIIIRTVDP